MSRSEIIVTILVAILGSSSLTTVISTIVDRLSTKNPFKQGSKFTLLFALQTEARRLINEGEVEMPEYNQFCEMYSTYKKMGGDGYADSLKAQIDKLVGKTIEEGKAS